MNRRNFLKSIVGVAVAGATLPLSCNRVMGVDLASGSDMTAYSITGRMSSTGPNYQELPKGYWIHDEFVCEKEVSEAEGRAYGKMIMFARNYGTGPKKLIEISKAHGMDYALIETEIIGRMSNEELFKLRSSKELLLQRYRESMPRLEARQVNHFFA